MHHQCSWSAHRRIGRCFHRRSKNWCCRRPTVAATLDPIETVCGVLLHMNASGLASPHHLEADSRTWQINDSVVPIAAKVQYQDTRSSQGEGQPTAREGRALFFLPVPVVMCLVGVCGWFIMAGGGREGASGASPKCNVDLRPPVCRHDLPLLAAAMHAPSRHDAPHDLRQQCILAADDDVEPLSTPLHTDR